MEIIYIVGYTKHGIIKELDVAFYDISKALAYKDKYQETNSGDCKYWIKQIRLFK